MLTHWRFLASAVHLLGYGYRRLSRSPLITHFVQVWGVSIGAAILQNELGTRLPPEFLQTVLGNTKANSSNINLAYSVIPVIRTLPEPLKYEVHIAFSESLAVIWKTMTGIVGIGLLASLMMRDVQMHKYVDEKWNIPAEELGAERIPSELQQMKGSSTVLSSTPENV